VTYEEVKRRFRELALKYHPDKYKGNKQVAAEKFKKIFEAYNKIREKMKMEA
jgi:DnaJ-class molecular chaperone